MAPTWDVPVLLLLKRSKFFVLKRSPLDFIEVPLVTSGVNRYIRTILRFCGIEGQEVEVQKQEFFMKTSYAYFKAALFEP